MTHTQTKLRGDQYEALMPLCDSGNWKALMDVVEQFTAEIDKEVLTYNLKDGPERLVILKAQSEGAHHLERRLHQLRTQVIEKVRGLKQGRT